VYALLFTEHGVTPGAMSSLFVIWSVTSFLLEVPSGAWADIVDRRTLLVLSGPVYAAGFAIWTVWPTYAGFAIGFVLWGLSSALMSGTFEALLYDSLAARGATDDYAGLLGRANSAATAASVAAIAGAAPLLAWGGFPAVGAVSVGVALLHGALARTLPVAPRAESADPTKDGDGAVDENAAFIARYIATLRAGVVESTRKPRVRHLVIIAAALYGLTAYDEYFPAVATEAGASANHVPLLVSVTVVGQFIGSAVAGRTAKMSHRAMTIAIAAGGTMIAAGAVARHPVGFVAIAVGYGLIENAAVISDARLQDSIEGPARATVTSVAGLSAEVVAVAIFATVALGSARFSVSAMLAVVAVPTIAVAAVARRWWPDRSGGRPNSESAAVRSAPRASTTRVPSRQG
jgi:MFS family permease